MSSSSRFKGILSNRTNNRTDDTERSIKQMILSLIGLSSKSLKNPTILIDTLYYKTTNFIDLTFIPYQGTSDSPFSGITVACMTDSSYEVDPSSNITFVGYRIPLPDPNTSGFTANQYNETITVQTLNGNFSAVATYSDSGTGFETTNTFQDYMILNGTGKYAYAKLIRIVFDNKLHQRQVFVYAYVS
jgi:hypothetical protein